MPHDPAPPRPSATEPLVWLGLVGVATAVSAVEPFDRLIWWLEAAPAVAAALLLLAVWRRFPLSPLATRLVALHALVLVLGAHYTYARVPLGEWAREAFDLSRNHYDRLGHVVQGFVPAIVTREVLLRTSPLRPGRWLAFLVGATCLAIAAAYELIEWWAALASDTAAEEFLSTQGDVWDTQWDMALCLGGAVAALLLLGRAHDRSLRAVGVDVARSG